MILLNDSIVNPTIFPDHTSQIWKIDPKLIEKGRKVEWHFESEGEFMHLAQLMDLLNQIKPMQWELYMPYLPYGRQDKDISNDQTFALHTFANLLNALDFKTITVYDPHSSVASKIIAGFEEKQPDKEVVKWLAESKSNVICYPDNGAVSKYAVRIGLPFIYGLKERDQATGNITKYNVVTDFFPVDGKSVLIVDDICDGGMTFILLCKDLKEKGASHVHLFVSHGIFSKGLKVLRDAGISRIFTKEGEIV